MNEERSSLVKRDVGKKRRIRLNLWKRKSPDEENFSENRIYYERLANRYHSVRTLAILLLAVVILFFGSMTYTFLTDNQFQYLYKVWTVNPVTVSKKYNDIAYAAGNGAKFVFYKNDLAVIESGKVTVYDLSGDRRFRAEAPNSAQAFAVSERYVALYTPGDKNFAIYDSFSEVYNHLFPYPIRLAAVSDSGKFALCLREEERTVVEVYNQNSVKEFSVTLGENTIIYDLDLSPNGDKLALTTMEGGNLLGAGNYYTEISLWDVSSEKTLFSERLEGKKPVATSFFDNTRLFFAAQGSVIFCQANGKKTETVTVPTSYTVDSDGKTLAVSDGSSAVTLYNSKGEKKTEFSLSEKIFDLKVKDGCCYVFSSKSISAYDADGTCTATYAVNSGVLDFFPLDDGSLLVCYVTETKRFAP